MAHADALAIAAADGLVLPVDVQPENRKTMRWSDWLRGARLRAGDRVGAA